ncbi:MAG: hypothetical protein EBY32_00715 [Proteobacteria bacterium]|nr:hypothetical protein [Pseudomonadota bacterium]
MSALPIQSGEAKSDSAVLIEWLLQDGRDLKGIPFSEVLAATTGKDILPVAPDAPWLQRLGAVLDRTLAAMNDTAHPIHSVGRINEASRFIEDQLMAECNKEPGWSCGIPRTSAGEEQRSGYPDLRLVLEDQSVVYLDPKLFARGSKTSTLRTFYYEPKTTTSKVHDDARHLLVGVQHNGGEGGQIRFEEWDLVDVSKIKVQLKAEFQAANKDLYRSDTILLKSSSSK